MSVTVLKKDVMKFAIAALATSWLFNPHRITRSTPTKTAIFRTSEAANPLIFCDCLWKYSIFVPIEYHRELGKYKFAYRLMNTKLEALKKLSSDTNRGSFVKFSHMLQLENTYGSNSSCLR